MSLERDWKVSNSCVSPESIFGEKGIVTHEHKCLVLMSGSPCCGQRWACQTNSDDGTTY